MVTNIDPAAESLTSQIIDLDSGEVQSDYTGVFLDDSNIAIKDTLNHVEDIMLHTGVRKGLALTVNADDTKFDVAVGSGIIVDKADPVNTIITRISFPETLAISDTNLSETISHIYIDNTGTLTVETDPPTQTDLLTRLYLGGLLHESSVITEPLSNPLVAHGTSITELENLLLGGGIKLSGGDLSAASTDLSLDMTAIIVEQFGRNFVSNPTTPNVVNEIAQTPVLAANFFKVFTDGSGDLVIDPATNTDQLAPTQFNEDGLGTLETVANNQYTVIRVFFSATTNNLLFYYGTEEFVSSSIALNASEPTFNESSVTLDTSPIAKIVIREDVTDLASGISGGTVIIKPISIRSQL